MIIFDNLGILTRSDMPNADWTGGEARYVVDDNSELAAKVGACAPYFEPVEDADGNLVDVIPLPRLEPPEPEPTTDITEIEEALKILMGVKDDELVW